MAEYDYWLLRGALCRRPRSDGRLQVLTAHGWSRCGWTLERYLTAKQGKASSDAEETSSDTEEASAVAEGPSDKADKAPPKAKGGLREVDVLRRARRACSSTELDPTNLPPWRNPRLWLPIWWLSPPLPQGAPRFVTGRVKTGCESFATSLPETVGADVVGEASTGLTLARERLAGIQSRAATLVQAAGLTSTLVLANGTLLVSGSDGPSEGAATVIAIALAVASVALICTGVYGLAAVMWTFGRIAPDNTKRVIERAKAPEGERNRQRAAATLLAHRRTSLVADWKLARLKRAVACFVVTIAGVAVASGALVADSLL